MMFTLSLCRLATLVVIIIPIGMALSNNSLPYVGIVRCRDGTCRYAAAPRYGQRRNVHPLGNGNFGMPDDSTHSQVSLRGIGTTSCDAGASARPFWIAA